jgi:flavin reductase (DIM6/NTAB) family NADH-FMN oxidoreductase RutF
MSTFFAREIRECIPVFPHRVWQPTPIYGNLSAGNRENKSGRKIMKRSLGARVIVGTTPVWIVGTYDREGKANIMAAAWVGVCCSEPPCVAVSLRKATYTYGNIQHRKAFTVSLPSAQYAKEADYCGIASGRDVDKFSKARLTPVKSELVDAPYVQEFPLVLECRLLHTIEIGLHTQFIGEIVDVKAEEFILNEKQRPQAEKIDPFFFNTATLSYYRIGEYLGKAFSIGKEA